MLSKIWFQTTFYQPAHVFNLQWRWPRYRKPGRDRTGSLANQYRILLTQQNCLLLPSSKCFILHWTESNHNLILPNVHQSGTEQYIMMTHRWKNLLIKGIFTQSHHPTGNYKKNKIFIFIEEDWYNQTA